MNIPANLSYTKSHEWVQKAENGSVKVGLTDFAQEALGNLVFVNLPEVDDEVEMEGTIADVESVKAVSDIYSPVTGVITAINEEVLDSPELINTNPYDTWLFEVGEVSETVELLDAAAYEAFCKEEE